MSICLIPVSLCDKITRVMIYLDYAADYPVRKETLEALINSELLYHGNMNSLHVFGEKALRHFQELQHFFLALFGLSQKEYEVIFTSSASEANNLAIKGIYESYSGYGNRILTSKFEHNSVNAVLSYLKNKGADVSFVPTTKQGKMDEKELVSLLNGNTILTCLALVESEVGAIQDYRKIQEIIHQSKCGYLLLDATQAIGKIPVDLNGIDLISFTPHKYGGLKGTGFLIKRKDIILTPLIHGGKSGFLFRAGTEPLSLFESSYIATRPALEEQPSHLQKVREKADYLLSELKQMDKVTLNSMGDNPYIINFSAEGFTGAALLAELSERGFAVSQKSACSIPNTPSKAVMSIYHDKKRALSSIRISLSSLTKRYELEQFVSTLKGILYGKK